MEIRKTMNKQRELKFRFYDKTDKRMNYFGGIWNMPDPSYDFDDIQQFTGLLDKNGKEIYEGDITQDVDTGKTFEIMYQGHMFMRYERKPMYMFYTLDGDCLEVIGNIYENPELIGERHED